jgi:hypothetical protein
MEGNSRTIAEPGDQMKAGFNPHIYENFLVQLESQIEGWNRSAVRNPCHLNHNFAVWQGYGLNSESPSFDDRGDGR